MKLSEMYSIDKPIIEEVEFYGASIGIKLLSDKDIQSMAKKMKKKSGLIEVIGGTLYEEGKSYAELGITEATLKSMPRVRSEELLALILSTNGIGQEIQDVKKN